MPYAVSMYRNHLYPIPDLTGPQSYPPLLPLTIALAWIVAGFSIRLLLFVGLSQAVRLDDGPLMALASFGVRWLWSTLTGCWRGCGAKRSVYTVGIDGQRVAACIGL